MASAMDTTKRYEEVDGVRKEKERLTTDPEVG